MYKMIFGLKALLVSAFFVLASNVLQSIYIPTLAVDMGMSSFEVSLLGSFYFLGFVIGCLVLPKYLYAVGHIRTFSAFAAVAAISTLIISMTRNPSVWMLCRLITGISLAALYMSIESWVSGFSNKSNRGQLISIYRIVDILGCIAGQSILFSFSTYPDILNLAAMGFLISFIPLSLTKIQNPVLTDTNTDRLASIAKSVFKTTPLGLYGVVLSGLGSGVFWSLLPIFTQDNGFNDKFNSIFVILYLLGGALVQWPIGVLSDKIDRRKTILFSSFVALISCWSINFLVFTQNSNLNLLLLCIFFVGVGSIPIYSLSISHTNDGINKNSLIGLSVLMLVLSSIGSVVGPLAFGLSSKIIEPKYLFVVSAVSHTLLFLVGIYYLITKDKIKHVNKKVFMFLTRTNSLVVAGGSVKVVKE